MIRRVKGRGWLAALLVAFFCGSLTSSVQADISDTLFSTIRQAAVAAGVDPDAIEMAKFSLNYPEDAATVYARAASEDYPFFGLVGAAKAAKNRNIPGAGLFDKNACKTPIRFVNGVFDQASSKISQGQAKTNTMTGQAKNYAAAYAQAANESGRQQAISALNQNVPYFQDIGTICNFAFETNFKIEADLQRAVNDTSKKIRSAYANISSGNVVSGVADLVGLGVSPTVACDLVDTGVSGGLIGKTPYLGDLAKGACKGFIGQVIDGIGGTVKDVANTAYNTGKDVVCAVYAFFGDGCSASSPPPTGFSEAKGYCSNKGGMESLESRTNAANDYSVRCNDGSMCRVRPDKKSCVTAAEMAQQKARTIQVTEIDFRKHMPEWAADFEGRWTEKCLDDNCRTGVKLIRLNAVQAGEQRHVREPATPFTFMFPDIFWPADQQAALAVNESIARSAALNKSITANAAPGWALLAIGAWTPRCADPWCVTEINGLANQMAARSVQLQGQQPGASALNIQGQAGREFGPQFQTAVNNSVLRQNVSLTPDQRLLAMNCTHLFGRAKEYLCLGPYPGYEVCVNYAKLWQVDACQAANRPRVEKPAVLVNLLPAGPTLNYFPGVTGGGSSSPPPPQARPPARAGGRPPPQR